MQNVLVVGFRRSLPYRAKNADPRARSAAAAFTLHFSTKVHFYTQ
jgi:hypothetical protein